MSRKAQHCWEPKTTPKEGYRSGRLYACECCDALVVRVGSHADNTPIFDYYDAERNVVIRVSTVPDCTFAE